MSRVTTTAVAGRDMSDERPGFWDRLIRLPNALPGPWWIWPVVLTLLSVAIPTAVYWLTATAPVGVVDPRIWLPALLSGYTVGLILLLDRVAVAAFGRFEQALGSRTDKPVLVDRLVSLPDRLTSVVVAIVLVIVTAGYLSDPSEFNFFATRQPVYLVLLLLTGWTAIGLGGVLLVHTYTQLRAVDRLHRMAGAIDLFNPNPAQAFARLTAATGIGIVIFGGIVLGDPTAVRDSLFYPLLGLFVIGVAASAFAVPLRGMNILLTTEKARLLHVTNEHLKETIARIHAGVDSDDLSRADKLQQTLSSLIAERDLISRLSTWPWSTNLFRGFASALLLPVVLFLITRALSELV